MNVLPIHKGCEKIAFKHKTDADLIVNNNLLGNHYDTEIHTDIIMS